MEKFPKTLNTKQDVLNVLQLYPAETKAYLQRCVDDRWTWRSTGSLAQGAAGVQDETHKVVAVDSGFEQYERFEDVNCELFRLGFTVAEAEEIING